MNCFSPPTTPEQILGNRFSGRSYFEPGQHKVALERCETANKSCEVHAEIFESYAQILEHFQKDLAKWKTDSEKKIHQTKEFGTNKDSFLSTIRAMETIGERPAALSKHVREEIVQPMKSYREHEFERGVFHSKKYKNFEKLFNKAQKPWVDLLGDINEKWAEISKAQSALDSAARAVRYCDGDVGAEEEKKESAKQSLAKREDKMKKLRNQYKTLLDKSKTERETYHKAMIAALEVTHTFERERLAKFLQSFQKMQELMTVKTFEKQTDVAEAFQKAISKHNIEADITYWNTNYGSASELPWGVIQELKE